MAVVLLSALNYVSATENAEKTANIVKTFICM